MEMTETDQNAMRRGRLRASFVFSYLKDRRRGFSGWGHKRLITNLDH